jgi:hypothetical protein
MSFLDALFATSTVCLGLLGLREPVRAHSLYYRAKMSAQAGSLV